LVEGILDRCKNFFKMLSMFGSTDGWGSMTGFTVAFTRSSVGGEMSGLKI